MKLLQNLALCILKCDRADLVRGDLPFPGPSAMHFNSTQPQKKRKTRISSTFFQLQGIIAYRLLKLRQFMRASKGKPPISTFQRVCLKKLGYIGSIKQEYVRITSKEEITREYSGGY